MIRSANAVLFAATTSTPFTAFITDDPREIELAQALRYQAFSSELGAPLPNARFSTRLGTRIDVDAFDAYSTHLLVRHEPSGEIVGCYRIILPAPSGQREVFTDVMFELGAELHAIKDTVAEWGRATIAKDFRGGIVSILLRIALLEFYERSGFRYAMGCMSVRMDDGVHPRATLIQCARKFIDDTDSWSRYLSATPRRPVEVDGVPLLELPAPPEPVAELVPPTIRVAVRYGGQICSEPSYDPDFEMADFLVLFDAERMRRHGFLDEVRDLAAHL